MDGGTTPFQVFAWQHGRIYRELELRPVFYALRSGRRIDRAGYIRFRHWRIYAEEGIVGATVAIWLYEESLTLVFADDALAAYTVSYQPDQTHFTTITEPQLFETRHRSRQLRLWNLRDDEWNKVYRVQVIPRRRHRRLPVDAQLALPLDEVA